MTGQELIDLIRENNFEDYKIAVASDTIYFLPNNGKKIKISKEENFTEIYEIDETTP